MALRPADLDLDQCLVLLREKGGTVRWQPVSPTLMRHLQQHVDDRPAPPATPQIIHAGPGGDQVRLRLSNR